MKSTRIESLLFLIAMLVVVPFLYSEKISTSALLTKYIGWSSSLFTIILFSFGSLKKKLIRVDAGSLFLVGFFLLTIPSTILAINSTEAVYETSKIFLFLVTFFLAKNYLSEETAVKDLALLSSITTFILLLVLLPEFSEAFRNKSPWNSTSYLIKGVSGHRNLAAAFIVLLIPATAMGYFRKENHLKLLFGLTLGIQFLLVVSLTARASIAALIACCIIFSVFQKFGNNAQFKHVLKIKKFGLIGFVAVLIALISFTSIPENVLAEANFSSSSFQERTILWKNSIAMIKEQSFFGVGGGNWKIYFPKYGLEGLYRAEVNNTVFRRPHNDYLWIWSQHGILALICFLSAVGLLFWRGLTTSLQENHPTTRLAALGIIAFLILSSFDFPLERVEHLTLLAIYLALLSRASPLSLAQPNALQVLKTPILILTLVGISYFIILGFMRFQAEISIKNMLNAKNAGNNQLMVEEALKVNQKFMSIDDNGMPIHWYAGIAYFNLNNIPKASEHLIKAAPLNPFNFNVINNASAGYLQAGNLDFAEKMSLRAIELNSKFDDPKINLTIVKMRQEKWQEAHHWILQVNPTNPNVQHFKNQIESHL